MTTQRGPYRSVYESIWDDPDFVALGRDGQQLWFVLKHALGPSGIAIVTLGDLEERFFARDRQELEAYLKLLRDRSWIVYEWIAPRRALIWLRNGLLHEPSLRLSNRNHAKAVLRHVSALPSNPMVGAFLEYYQKGVAQNCRGSWQRALARLSFLCVQESYPQPVDGFGASPQLSLDSTHPNGIPMGSGTPSEPIPDQEKGDRRKDKEEGLDQDQEHVLLERTVVRTPAGPPAGPNGDQKHGSDQASTPRSRILDDAIGEEDPRHGRIRRIIGGLRPEKPEWLDELLQDLANPHEGISHLNHLARDIASDSTKSPDDWIRIVQDEIGALARSP